ncbi:MAG: RHS repeat-associated core domain-containing protein, partial [Planctomycetota bacterium]
GTSWEDYHILHGGQDTAAKLVNQSGQVVEQYEYDPFGKATVYTAAGALVDVGPAGTSPEDGTRSAYGLTHLYKAMRLDPETGNCYVRNRFYDPRTGRFMSRDPIGVWGDAGNMGNEYAYAWNRPLVVGDPLGLQSPATSGSPSRLDNVRDQYNKIVAKGREWGANKAADLLQYFIDGKGGALEVPHEWICRFQEVTDASNTNRQRFIDQIQAKALELGDGESGSFTDYWDSMLTGSVFSELFYASGTSTVTSIATFHMSRSGDTICISGRVVHWWWDPYDWHEGLGAYIPGVGRVSDEDALYLQKFGGAAPFLMFHGWANDIVATYTIDGGPLWFDSYDVDISYGGTVDPSLRPALPIKPPSGPPARRR